MARILVIDDDRLVRQVVCLLLERAGHDVASACDGAEGLARMCEGGFELVVTDLVMPVKDGIETIRELRREHPGVKILAVSATDRPPADHLLQLALQVGADQAMRKPICGKELGESVRRLVPG